MGPYAFSGKKKRSINRLCVQTEPANRGGAFRTRQPLNPFIYVCTPTAHTRTRAPPHTQTQKQSKTPPEHRLPLCYLMDSLLQNARAPYPGLFARYVVPMLCRTYEFVRGALWFGLV